MQPLVSIIIPTYNRAHLIGETLESVIAQTYENWECIVVDDGSKDYTDELLKFYCKKDSRIQYHRRPKDRQKGANACRNYGFEMSVGGYILFLDSDDLIEIFCLEERVNYFKIKKSDFIIADTGTLKGHKKSILPINNSNKAETFLLSFLNYKVPWTVMSVLWKREILEKFKFNESLTRFQDVEFHIRILMYSDFSYYRISKVDNFYRVRKSDKRKNDQNHREGVVYSLLILLDEFSEDFKKDKKKRNAFKRFFYVICRDFIFLKPDDFKKYFEYIFKETRRNNFFNIYDKLIFRIYYVYTYFDLKNINGVGIHKLRKISNKYYDNLNNSF